ncbi:MAG: NADH-quinone oxidoreductase subunit L [Symbiobacterium sp.]|uniref:NADH-quinone oxidoreductase subunit L n=1 Tax=Symbiobacterium sp. TaxID=1971213 RepID=UPI003464C14E
MDFFLNNAWVIAALPLAVSVAIAMFAGLLRDRVWVLGTGGMLITFLWSVFVLVAVISGQPAAAHGPNYFTEPAWHASFDWASLGPYVWRMGFQVDNLTALMLPMITLVSFAVQLYSSAYMHGDKRVPRFYSAINLFTLGMLLLVLADNLFLLLVAWEIMGLCSYLLIGHWYEQAWPRYGQIKAFLTTRVGDVGMMMGIFIIFFAARDLTWAGLAEKMPTLVQDPVTAGLLALGAFLIFTGAIGKSAQFPLHVWLPDAMAGPTPGSAIIHAATMVAAGVYLIGRAFMIYGNVAPWVLAVVTFVGAFTSLFAATIATLRWDIKEVLAYSTISQLGYMIMAIGLGGWTSGNFHLLTHAFFKALLFLAAGSVIHAHHHNQLLHKMGGLRKKIPVTFWTWMVGYAALAGVPGFSGFFSKDGLLADAWMWSNPAVPGWALKLPFIMALTTAFLTAYYMTRATYLAFFGEPRDKDLYEHAHESPRAMTVPLVILAVPAALFGWLGTPLFHHFTHADWMIFVQNFLHLPGLEHHIEFSTELLVTGMATTAGLLGIFLGWYLYAVVKPETRAAWIASLKPVYNLVRNKYYVDEFYELAIIKTTQAFSRAVAWFDGAVVDGLVNLAGTVAVYASEVAGWFDRHVVDFLVTMWADIARGLGAAFRRLSTGLVQQYMLTFFAMLVAGVVLVQVIR